MVGQGEPGAVGGGRLERDRAAVDGGVQPRLDAVDEAVQPASPGAVAQQLLDDRLDPGDRAGRAGRGPAKLGRRQHLGAAEAGVDQQRGGAGIIEQAA